MRELAKFIRDPRFYAPFAIVLAFEVFLQSGVYARLLEPNSYAASVRHIMRTTEASEVRPNVLILGTSVAYQDPICAVSHAWPGADRRPRRLAFWRNRAGVESASHAGYRQSQHARPVSAPNHI